MTHSNSQREGGRAGLETNTEGERSALRSVLFTLVFLSQSDAGVCRHAWRLPRCGLWQQDHYRQSGASESNRARYNLALFSPVSLLVTLNNKSKKGIICANKEMTLLSNTANQCICQHLLSRSKEGGWRFVQTDLNSAEKRQGVGRHSFFSSSFLREMSRSRGRISSGH